MNLKYRSVPQWPRLAWLAECWPGSATTLVHHGSWVEARDGWLCEAVWDGEFDAGDFDTTRTMGGTGVRVRNGHVRFVASGSNLDRLQSAWRDGAFSVSNSLSCLMSWIDARPDLTYGAYTKDFASYRYAFLGTHGRSLPTSNGTIEMTYCADLVWDGRDVEQVEKPHQPLEVEGFEAYTGFLKAGIGRMVRNAGSDMRRHRFSFRTPLSTGYDSPALAALAKEAGDPTGFTFSTDREGRDDSGAHIGALLGVPVHVIDRDAWRDAELAEVPFLACSGSVGDLAFRGAEHVLSGAFVLNGLGSEVLWSRRTKSRSHVPPEFGDGNLLGLQEYQLRAGFVQFPVPLLGVGRVEDVRRVQALTDAPEMDPWDVAGDYSKPICRRILEEAGVPRQAFGTSKKGVSEVPLRGEYLSPSSRTDFLKWIAARRAEGQKVPSAFVARLLDGVLTPLAKMVRSGEQSVRAGGSARRRFAHRIFRRMRSFLGRARYHHHLVTHWAMDRAMLAYEDTGQAPHGNSQDAPRALAEAEPTKGPLVTIGISTYNRADGYLAESLQSAVAQTYPNLEIIVSDNASTDDTEAVVARHADSRVRYVKQPRNLGANGNFNYCLDQARGEFFLLLHDDDLLDADMIETCVRALPEDRDVGLVRTGTRTIDADGHVLAERRNEVAGLGAADFLLAYFEGRTSIYFASTLFHTQRLRDAGGIAFRHDLLEDGAALVKLLRHPRVDVVEVKASFRRHGDNRGTAQRIDLWCDDSRALLELMVEVAGPRGPEVRRAGLRFFSRQNYSRLQRAGARDPRSYRVVYETFDRVHSPFAFWLSRTRLRRIERAVRRRLFRPSTKRT